LEKRNLLEYHQEDSMSKSQPIYSKEFKQEAVRLFETSGKSKTQIARDLGISDSALSKWCKEYGNLGEDAFPGKGHQIPIEEENKKLRREVEILRQEREILKKALSIFTRPHL
jgi:transposase